MAILRGRECLGRSCGFPARTVEKSGRLEMGRDAESSMAMAGERNR